MNIHKFILAFIAVLAIQGCGMTGEGEIREWVAAERVQAKPRIKPLVEPKKFSPESYKMDGITEPFSNQKLTQALKRESAQNSANATLIAPELSRRKEPLEAYPLDAMAMVGSLNKKGKMTALLKVDSLLHQVEVGSYIGQNYGKIISIGETNINLREIVQDATGEWTERQTSLELQEGNKR